MQKLSGRRRLELGMVCLALVAVVWLGQAMLGRTVVAQGNMVFGPMFAVDPL